MLTQFLLFVITILLVSIFWVLSKINSVLKRRLPAAREHGHEVVKAELVRQ